jgi:hypothetical protein
MFVRETTHTARKAHRCSGCCQPIAPGESYVRWAGMTDGDFGTAAYHPDCRAWEIFLGQAANLYQDEWTLLHEFVTEDRASLDGAPESVRARFVCVVA